MIKTLKNSVAIENLMLSRHIFEAFMSMDHFASDASVCPCTDP